MKDWYIHSKKWSDSYDAKNRTKKRKTKTKSKYESDDDTKVAYVHSMNINYTNASINAVNTLVKNHTNDFASSRDSAFI